jgi:LPXTG-motif cell wall-anchored protein
MTNEGQAQAAPLVQDTLPRTGARHQLPLALAGALMAVGGALVTIRPVNRRA